MSREVYVAALAQALADYEAAKAALPADSPFLAVCEALGDLASTAVGLRRLVASTLDEKIAANELHRELWRPIVAAQAQALADQDPAAHEAGIEEGEPQTAEAAA